MYKIELLGTVVFFISFLYYLKIMYKKSTKTYFHVINKRMFKKRKYKDGMKKIYVSENINENNENENILLKYSSIC